MKKLTYHEAHDLIIQAYFKDEIKPLDPAFCFCGTLNQGDESWFVEYNKKKNGIYYTADELKKMEDPLLNKLRELMPNKGLDCFPFIPGHIIRKHPEYENYLFAGMSAALDVLKEIHRSRGEDVDGLPVFTKRELTALEPKP